MIARAGVLLALCAVLAGCNGGDGTANVPPPPDPAVQATQIERAVTDAQQLLDDIDRDQD